MPESLPESLHVSASIVLKTAKLFVAPASRNVNIVFNLSDVDLRAPNPNNTVPTSFGISNLECVTCQVRFRINY